MVSSFYHKAAWERRENKERRMKSWQISLLVWTVDVTRVTRTHKTGTASGCAQTVLTFVQRSGWSDLHSMVRSEQGRESSAVL